jgi:hypothetical protein
MAPIQRLDPHYQISEKHASANTNRLQFEPLLQINLNFEGLMDGRCETDLICSLQRSRASGRCWPLFPISRRLGTSSNCRLPFYSSHVSTRIARIVGP